MSILEMSLMGGVTVLAITVLRAVLLNKLPKRTFIFLWELAMLRLVLPFSVPAVTSVYSIVDFFSKTESVQTLPDTTANIPVITDILTQGDPHTNEMPFYENISDGTAISPRTVVWLGGMAVMLVFFVSGYVAVYRKNFCAELVKGGYIEEWLSKQKTRRKIEIRRSEQISSPLTYGIFRPTVLLPENTQNKYSEQLDYILTHEMTHIENFDMLRKIAMAAVLCVHWFNPLVWVLFLLYNRDIELVCDETVIRKMGGDRRSAYAMTLICMEETKSKKISAFYSHFSRNAIQERIVAIMKFKKLSVLTVLAASAAVLGVTAAFTTSAANSEKRTDTDISAEVLIEGKTGKAHFSIDGGKTYQPLDDSDMPVVEWWTYDGYKAWLDNEKIELQKMLGTKGHTGSRGDFIWTQEIIDETVAMYENILEQIKNGIKVSKHVNGNEDTMLVQAVPVNSAKETEEMTREEILKRYGAFGISYSGDKMLYNGEEVRLFIDGTEIEDGFAQKYVYYNENGKADVITEYRATQNPDGSSDPFGKLTGLRKATKEEFDNRSFGYRFDEAVFAQADGIAVSETFETVDKIAVTATDADASEIVSGFSLNAVAEDTVAEGNSEGEGRTLEDIFAPLKKYGVEYKDGVVRWNGELVDKFFDINSGSVFSYSTGKGGKINIKTVYDENGDLCGVEKTDLKYESDLRK